MIINATKKMILVLLLTFAYIFTQAAGLMKNDPAPTVYDSVMINIRNIQWAGVKDTASLRNTVSGLVSSMQANGSWTDINYADRSQTNWIPVTHLDRLKTMALAYTFSGGYWYANSTLQQRISDGLAYWYTAHPTSTNWYMQQIASPQRVGILLILMRAGAVPVPAATENNLLSRMAAEGGRPDQSGSLGTGANKLDIATHWIYRGCLTADSSVLSFGVSQAYYPIMMTTGEGIQYDLSYMQHGMQLYIGGYGSVLLNGEINVALYTTGTSYALAGTLLDLLSRFARHTYFGVIRGRYQHFDVLGRGVSRPNALNQSGGAGTATSLKTLDPANSTAYDSIISRLNGSQPASYGIRPGHIHYHKSDYSLHTRPGYSFDVRTVSTRTLRNENGNGENLKGYFLADGGTNITTNGDEYYNIFPVWDWVHIPGVTAPVLTGIPLPTAWGTAGTSTFTGGVSDSLYGATAYDYTDNSYSINTKAKKSWFFFNDEVVCLGAGITSTAAQPVNTTVNQCLLNGPVTVVSNGTASEVGTGAFTYNNNVSGILHNGIGYIFPQAGKVSLSNQVQTGTWKSINSSSIPDTISKSVFKLWLDHGTQSVNNSYAYIVVPGLSSAAALQAYDTSRIRIMANTDTVQAVKHTGSGIWEIVFFKAATFTYDSVTIQADAGCALILKNVGTPQVSVHIADPSQTKSNITLRLKLPSIAHEKALACTMPASPYAGATVSYIVSDATPDYVPALTRTVYPIADAYVNDGANAAVNFGTATSLIIKKDNTGYNREVFVKFSLPTLDTAQISKVVYGVKVRGANTSITTTTWQTKYVTDDSWTETGITWNNKPASGELLATAPGSTAGTVASFDITAKALEELRSGNGILSLHMVSTLRGDAKTDASFWSRENADSTVIPQLTIYLKQGNTARLNTATTLAPIPEKAAGNGLQLAPNPAGDNVYITSNQTEQLIITDAAGNVVKRFNITASTRKTIDVTTLPPGMYYVRGISSRAVQKLLIIR
ncbi:MAG TPA: polysaccharide lyase family 8 super-sandwich domain-containing protein [Chitinophaga sp.]|uniref:polysaccharide lyase family 8 super-sandwich domain-containing protein n=1 Tax=Chitinophaga sp. TaxID=1869181 RepID=UPI002B91195B|nr:polysaccharide lyase family 8 super-sandwich domain-containing protein [Chitinophaga sp.]HVI43917.1 polysaccharide lyase family 8 super-sandwich domain-containing protein [Chitinophaga sp.]